MTQEYRVANKFCRDIVRKAKANLKLNLARDVKTNEKRLYKYITAKGRLGRTQTCC